MEQSLGVTQLVSLRHSYPFDRTRLKSFRAFSPDLEVVELAGVVERAEADPAAGERLVVGGHGGGGHVVEVDGDEPVPDASDDPDVVPAVVPGSPLAPGLGDPHA